MLFGCACKANEYLDVQKAGFDYAELPCREITAMNNDEFNNFADLANKTGFPILAMNIYCPPEIIIAGSGYNIAAVKQYAEKAAERAAILGVKGVGIGSPRSRTLPSGFSYRLAVKQMSKSLQATAQEFAKYNINVCLEALGLCYSNFVNTIPEAFDIVDSLNISSLGIVLDFYNMEHSGEAEISLEPYIKRILHAHISDDDGTPSKRSYLKPEKREIHIRRIKRLLTNNYNSSLTLETDVPFDFKRAQQTLEIMQSSL